MQGKKVKYSKEKDKLVRKGRGIDLKEVAAKLEKGHVLTAFQHPNKARYPTQIVYIVEMNGYPWKVPCVIDENGCLFIKTACPDRKFKKYIKGGKNDKEAKSTKKTHSR